MRKTTLGDVPRLLLMEAVAIMVACSWLSHFIEQFTYRDPYEQ